MMKNLATTPNIIRTERLSKRYGDIQALDSVNISVKRGEVYGFLGPNGAGKTTTILLLLGLLKPTSGNMFLFGDLIRSRHPALFLRTGVMQEEQQFYEDMTAREYLAFFAQLVGIESGKKAIDECLDEVGLENNHDRLIASFSHGMRQKLALARATIHNPDLLFLDEPVSGLDPVSIVQVRELLIKRKRQGTTVFISSHVLSEVERVADRVGILSRGKLLVEGELAALRELARSRHIVEVELSSMPPALLETFQRLPFVLGVERKANNLQVEVKSDNDYRAILSEAINTNGGVILRMHTRVPSLEDAYVTITEGNLPYISNLVST
jgi:ABC-2 type transport system ATP-binding protein